MSEFLVTKYIPGWNWISWSAKIVHFIVCDAMTNIIPNYT